jgi:hypothetical protein
VADTERQSEIASRVSTWKERIEDALEEQVSFTKVYAELEQQCSNFEMHKLGDIRNLGL